ncbi:YciI family protein [Pararhodospirillum photometricum]|nr:YciI family protein [Pararhodospirillum photometricum]
MLFAVYCLDKPDHAEVRLANREAHLAYARSWEAQKKIVFGGPLLSPDGSAMIGSLLVFDVADQAEAEAFCAGDPYGVAGLFASVTVTPYKLLLGTRAQG